MVAPHVKRRRRAEAARKAAEAAAKEAAAKKAAPAPAPAVKRVDVFTTSVVAEAVKAAVPAPVDVKLVKPVHSVVLRLTVPVVVIVAVSMFLTLAPTGAETLAAAVMLKASSPLTPSIESPVLHEPATIALNVSSPELPTNAFGAAVRL